MPPVDAGQIEKFQLLIDKGPQTFVAGAFFVLFVMVLGLYVRTVTAHKNEIKAMLEAERERAIKQEMVAHGFLELVRQGQIAVKPGKRRGSGDPLGAESGTGSFKLPPGIGGPPPEGGGT